MRRRRRLAGDAARPAQHRRELALTGVIDGFSKHPCRLLRGMKAHAVFGRDESSRHYARRWSFNAEASRASDAPAFGGDDRVDQVDDRNPAALEDLMVTLLDHVDSR